MLSIDYIMFTELKVKKKQSMYEPGMRMQHTFLGMFAPLRYIYSVKFYML